MNSTNSKQTTKILVAVILILSLLILTGGMLYYAADKNYFGSKTYQFGLKQHWQVSINQPEKIDADTYQYPVRLSSNRLAIVTISGSKSFYQIVTDEDASQKESKHKYETVSLTPCDSQSNKRPFISENGEIKCASKDLSKTDSSPKAYENNGLTITPIPNGDQARKIVAKTADGKILWEQILPTVASVEISEQGIDTVSNGVVSHWIPADSSSDSASQMITNGPSLVNGFTLADSLFVESERRDNMPTAAGWGTYFGIADGEHTIYAGYTHGKTPWVKVQLPTVDDQNNVQGKLKILERGNEYANGFDSSEPGKTPFSDKCIYSADHHCIKEIPKAYQTVGLSKQESDTANQLAQDNQYLSNKETFVFDHPLYADRNIIMGAVGRALNTDEIAAYTPSGDYLWSLNSNDQHNNNVTAESGPFYSNGKYAWWVTRANRGRTNGFLISFYKLSTKPPVNLTTTNLNDHEFMRHYLNQPYALKPAAIGNCIDTITKESNNGKIIPSAPKKCWIPARGSIGPYSMDKNKFDSSIQLSIFGDHAKYTVGYYDMNYDGYIDLIFNIVPNVADSFHVADSARGVMPVVYLANPNNPSRPQVYTYIGGPCGLNNKGAYGFNSTVAVTHSVVGCMPGGDSSAPIHYDVMLMKKQGRFSLVKFPNESGFAEEFK